MDSEDPNLLQIKTHGETASLNLKIIFLLNKTKAKVAPFKAIQPSLIPPLLPQICS